MSDLASASAAASRRTSSLGEDEFDIERDKMRLALGSSSYRTKSELGLFPADRQVVSRHPDAGKRNKRLPAFRRARLLRKVSMCMAVALSNIAPCVPKCHQIWLQVSVTLVFGLYLRMSSIVQDR